MDFLNKFVKAVVKPRFEEDNVDRLNYQLTVWILSISAIFISTKQFFGDPIQCWVPAEFPGAWKQYVDSYCFVESTYYVSIHQDIHEARNQPNGPPVIGYYQWVPVVLGLQAFMFFLPHMIWRLLNWQSGINIRSIVSMACDKNIGRKAVDDTVSTIAGHMEKALEFKSAAARNGARGNPVNWVLTCGRSSGWFVSILYLFTKLLWVVNIIAQFFILKDFLGITSNIWGIKVFSDIVSGKSWNVTGNFPRVTYCDFKIRVLANIQDRTVQCVLTINMFTEKIYLFVWWWFVLVAVITILNYIYWIYISMSASNRRNFIADLLMLGDDSGNDPEKMRMVNKFIDNLRPDGVLVFRLMCKNAGDVITFHVLHKLFTDFKKNMLDSGKNGTNVQASVNSLSAPYHSYSKGTESELYGRKPQTLGVPMG